MDAGFEVTTLQNASDVLDMLSKAKDGLVILGVREFRSDLARPDLILINFMAAVLMELWKSQRNIPIMAAVLMNIELIFRQKNPNYLKCCWSNKPL